MARRVLAGCAVPAACGLGAWHYSEETNRMIRSSRAYWALADAASAALRVSVADAETAHELAARALRSGLGPVARPAPQEVSCFGRTFASPIGVAAGFDKRGELVDALAEMGFGFVEVGGVTPEPQPGNERPRIFRLPEDGAIINRVGLPSEGVEVVAARLAARRSKSCVVGVNCAKQNAVDDYAVVAKGVARVADFVVVNASCPNVRGGVVADVADVSRALTLAKRACDCPVLVKISPDLGHDDLRRLVRALRRGGADGVVVANTTKTRPGLRSAHAGETGGLSGAPLAARTRRLVAEVFALSHGALPIVGVGGVATAEDAYALVRAGATLVQLYTALVYRGPSRALSLHADLAALAQADGFARIQDAVGADHREEEKKP